MVGVLADVVAIVDGVDGEAQLALAQLLEEVALAAGGPELELWAARRKGDMLEELADRKLRLTVDAVHEHEDATDARGRLQVVR